MKKEDLVKMIEAEFPGIAYRDIQEVCFGRTRAEAKIVLRDADGRIVRDPIDRTKVDSVTWIGEPYNGEWP